MPRREVGSVGALYPNLLEVVEPVVDLDCDDDCGVGDVPELGRVQDSLRRHSIEEEDEYSRI